MSSYRMFLDDERLPPRDETDWVVVRSFAEAVDCIERNGLPGLISFDHDLGDGPSGYDLARWLIDHVLDRDIADQFVRFRFVVHSQNPVGARNIEALLAGFKKHLNMADPP